MHHVCHQHTATGKRQSTPHGAQTLSISSSTAFVLPPPASPSPQVDLIWPHWAIRANKWQALEAGPQGGPIAAKPPAHLMRCRLQVNPSATRRWLEGRLCARLGAAQLRPVRGGPSLQRRLHAGQGAPVSCRGALLHARKQRVGGGLEAALETGVHERSAQQSSQGGPPLNWDGRERQLPCSGPTGLTPCMPPAACSGCGWLGRWTDWQADLLAGM
jgi:hypothetical protein